MKGSGGLGDNLPASPLTGECVDEPGESEHVDLLPAPAVAVSAMVAIERILDRAVKRLGVAAHLRVDGEVGGWCDR